MTNEITTKIVHGIYDVIFNNFYWRNPYGVIASFPFRDLIYAKALKWGKEYQLIHFTVGNDGDIWVISILHPWDQHKYTLKLGEDIVKGRLNRQLGLMKRSTYDRIPQKDENGKVILHPWEVDQETGERIILYKPVPPYIITGD